MIVDSHQHVFWHGRDDAGLIADMDAHGIDFAWLLSWDIAPQEDALHYHSVLNPVHRRPDGTHKGIPLSDLLLARSRYPDRFILGYCPHPLLGDAPGIFESAYHMYGTRVCGEWKFRIPFDDSRCIELFRKAGQLKCPVVLHLDVPYLMNQSGAMAYQPRWYGGTVDNLQRALDVCPETIFIAHAPGFWRQLSGDSDANRETYPKGPVLPGGKVIPLLERYPNLMADLSAGSALKALQRDKKFASEFLERFADRLLFGRDYYGTELHEFLQTLELSEEAREKIYFRNALRLVGKPAAGKTKKNA